MAFRYTETNEIKKCIKSFGLSEQVKLIGKVSGHDKVNFIQNCDLFVMPSYKVKNSIEGFGISYIEAASYGKPSRRTRFYKNFILKNLDWSSSLTTLESGQSKKDFDDYPVLDRMELQLRKSSVPTKYIKNIDLSWAKEDLSQLTQQYTNNN